MIEMIKSTHIPECYQKIKHSSGLEILLYPMEGYSSAYALFATKYGSVDTCFKTQDDADFVEVPEGIAHYLEHKMFESEEGDAFNRYAETGASANAYTSFDRTAYLFSCTDNFKESLDILLDFVTDPYFTPETVQKEQGIIGQEIMMYQDDADWRVFFGMLGGLYQHNPVSIDIAGTVESISHITSDLLYRCYNTFYNLNNMVLVVAGNVDPATVLDCADRILKPAKPMNIEHRIPADTPEVYKPLIEISLPIAQSLFQLGFKKAPQGEKEDFLSAITMEILLDMIAGETSPLYNRLYESGLINSTFSTSAESGRGYAYCSFGGESKDPKAVKEEILKELQLVNAQGLDPVAFEHCQKAAWGRFVGMYGGVSGVASLTLSSYFVGLNAFDVLDTVANVTLNDLDAQLREELNPQRCVLSIVNPT